MSKFLLSPLLGLGCLLSFANWQVDQESDRQERPDHVPESHELVYELGFNQEEALEKIVCTDKAAWRVAATEDAGHLELFQASKYQPTHRSPLNIALFRAGTVEDFVLDLDMMQTGREYGHRDLCLFFGFQDPEHFYYVHMATTGDQNAHQVFIVNDEPRTPITIKRNKGVDWGTDKWHHVRLVRSVSDGTIAVYFDDMENPIMEAKDQTFGAGYIGVGSFDDTGAFDNIQLWGTGWTANQLESFKKSDDEEK